MENATQARLATLLWGELNDAHVAPMRAGYNSNTTRDPPMG